MRFLGLGVATIEWYDYAIFLSLTDVISRTFFPGYDLTTRFCLYLSTIAIGYFGRPLGAFLFGKYSDNSNRLKAARHSFYLMIFASLMISFLPGYAAVGVYAPLSFLLFKFLQGMALGGNYGIAVFSAESAHKSERYFASSLVCMGFMLGFLIGGFVGFLLNYFFTQEFLLNMGWRYALWSSFLLSVPLIFMFPKKIDDIKKEKRQKKERAKFKTIMQMCLLMLLDMVPFYTFFVFLPNHKTLFLGYDPSIISLYNSLAMFTMLIFTPFFGKLADAYGAVRSLKIAALALIIVSCFAPWDSWLWCFVFGLIMSVCYGSLYGLVAMLFPKSIRAQTSGVVLNITAAVMGGTAPIICTFLVGISYILLSVFLALVGLIVLWALSTVNEKETYK